MAGSKSIATLQRLIALSIVGPLLAWLSFFWERCSGTTFVVSRSYTDVGRASTPDHLRWSLLAIGVTLVAIPVGWFSCAALREGMSRGGDMDES